MADITNNAKDKIDAQLLEQENITETANAEPTKTFTQEDLTRVAVKEAAKAERSILTALGISDKKDLESIVTSLKEFKAEQDAQMTISQRYETQTTTLAELQGKFDALQANYVLKEHESVLKDHKVPDKMRDYYQKKINDHALQASLSFDEAAKAYLLIDPLPDVPEKAPSTVITGIAGTTQLANAPANDALEAAKMAMGVT